MQRGSGKKKTLKAVILIAVLLVVALGAYAAITYPKIVVSFPVSFTWGADVEHKEFSMPLLHAVAQVEVAVSSGTTLWTASIIRQDETIWSDNAHQPDQTTYRSIWIGLPSGCYNFTFATAGLGSLEAEINVITKGGFW